MHVSDLTVKTQDYLKLIWDISERTGHHATLSEIATALDQRASTTSEAIKRLAAQDLVYHQPYGGISLTQTGRKYALAMARRHRLLETFLVHSLGYQWDEVHEEADSLEHAVSEKFLARIDDILGHPTHDPHGDPIPTATGDIEDLGVRHLGQLEPGAVAVVSRIHDGDPALLRYLDQHGIVPGAQVSLGERGFGGMQIVQVAGKEVALADIALTAITIADGSGSGES
ncbi:metal-dependent transcriptional regulator [Corynebacterium hindlerae]|uniref:Diphtheria toxin repressor n=1 Tax=Corynebacterium hindlerae TaxID=699041 RepID=A0A7G5FHE8_9CORY|nr:metal-dependent transcriptional regulator [Corynebacterium hindlerae]QMV86039.1 metal-dependent transcriptional regulator [Corynebacterium hindlerae]